MAVSVILYTIPQEACDQKKMNWSQAGNLLMEKLIEKFGRKVEFHHTEFLTASWFEDLRAQQMMEQQTLNLPFVLVDGELASSGEKIMISQVLRHVAKALND